MINEVLQEEVLERMECFTVLSHHCWQPIASGDHAIHQLWPLPERVAVVLQKLLPQPLLINAF